MRLTRGRIVRALVVVSTLLACTTPVPSRAATVSYAYIIAGGNAYYHFVRVCGWQNYDDWVCREQSYPFGTKSGMTDLGEWLVERDLYADIHFDNYGVVRCTLNRDVYRALPNAGVYGISFNVHERRCYYVAYRP